MVTLMLMNTGEFQIYLKSAVENYAKEKVLSNNWNEEESISKAREEYEKLLPKGETTENNFLYSILNEGQTIGAVWLEQKNNENGFIRDIRISEKYQGLGYGKEAMSQIEIMGKKLGLRKIGLHVFGHNKVARGLYEKLGYQTTNVMMIKEI
ncbi:GNAT family N-acetyltransferase [Virgibacillus litoralis]|uniref:Ribosomal protein S18 acetylase RimI-like enzyme n=1 Tax=Virgibacillus litoralis TaxID=578221 RepID=A0ABS4HHM1_9BACI|nr:GNAT family N-acetyltransferase [Virgibacillus litoralis]MBP1950421.1 ribosomal protein S18 acetylase RimI-like enzyme [Virgibacillus litoralis]